MNQRGNIALYVSLVIVGVVLVLGLGMGARYYTQKPIQEPMQVQKTETQNKEKLSTPISVDSIERDTEPECIACGPGINLETQKDIIISPNGAEVWKKGQQQLIRWKAASNLGQNVYLIVTNHGFCDDVESCIKIGILPPSISYTIAIVPNTGSYSWKVGYVSRSSFYDVEQGKVVTITEVPPGKYGVQITGQDPEDITLEIQDLSDKPFTITD